MNCRDILTLYLEIHEVESDSKKMFIIFRLSLVLGLDNTADVFKVMCYSSSCVSELLKKPPKIKKIDYEKKHWLPSKA